MRPLRRPSSLCSSSVRSLLRSRRSLTLRPPSFVSSLPSCQLSFGRRRRSDATRRCGLAGMLDETHEISQIWLCILHCPWFGLSHTGLRNYYHIQQQPVPVGDSIIRDLATPRATTSASPSSSTVTTRRLQPSRLPRSADGSSARMARFTTGN